MDFNKKVSNDNILKYSFKLFKENYKHYLPIILGFFILNLVTISFLVYSKIYNIDFFLNILKNPGTYYRPKIENFESIINIMLFSCLFVFFDFLYNIALIEKTYNLIIGKLEKFRLDFFLIINGILSSILYFFFIAIGFILFIVPAFIIIFKTVFFMQVLVINRLYYFKNFDKCFYITKDNLLDSVLFYYVISLIPSGINGLITNFFMTNKIINFYTFFLIPNIVSILFGNPFIHINMTIKYLNIAQIKGENLIPQKQENFSESFPENLPENFEYNENGKTNQTNDYNFFEKNSEKNDNDSQS